MSERKPPKAPKEVKQRADETRLTQIRKYELITPLFGGGVKPGFADPITIIRGTEIRGHLRFWWRATRGGESNGDRMAMKNAEDLLWGAASTKDNPMPSQVQIAVEVAAQDRGEVLPAFDPDGKEVDAQSLKSPYGYVAFPLRENPLREKQDAVLLKGIKFTLTIGFPQPAEPDVKAALWAWETFGGIGARTRRGCGALRLLSVGNEAEEKPKADVEAIKQKIKDQLGQYVSSGIWPVGVPHLNRSLEPTITKVERSSNKADSGSLRVWRTLIGALRRFRQSRPNGVYGRSHWPEPDAIRHEAGTHAELEEKNYEPRAEMPKRFPRAAFGLPIEFKFKDEAIGDPPKASLKGGLDPAKKKYRERLASRLIFRPLACGDDAKDDAAVGLAIILDAPELPPGGLTLHVGGKIKTVRADLDPADVGNIKPLNGTPDVLEAFLNTLPKEDKQL